MRLYAAGRLGTANKMIGKALRLVKNASESRMNEDRNHIEKVDDIILDTIKELEQTHNNLVDQMKHIDGEDV